MIYPGDFEIKIGFSPLRRLLMDKCQTSMGRERVAQMAFKSNPKQLKRELGGVSEMKRLIESGVALPQFSFYDVARWMKEARSPGSFLSSEQLYQTALTFRTM